MGRVAAIIVTYNGEKWIRQCLDSLLSSTLIPDIFLVDNNSSDDTAAVIEREYPKVSFFKSKENLGFGKANNIWLKKLFQENKEYEFFFLINQDAWVEKNCILQLVDFMKTHADYGILSPVQYNKDFSEIDFNFKEYSARGKNKGEVTEVPFVNAAVWMLSKSCLRKTGLFNPYFIHYGEDRNYCNRIKYNNLKIGILCNAKANHDRERTTDEKKMLKLAKIKLDCIVLNPDSSLLKAYIEAFKNVWGIPKYYLKIISAKQGIKMFFYLLRHYVGLIFSLEIIKNRKQQKKGVFLIEE
ncbi:MAG: glycosyltransferase [Flavobacteriaceae bacterium]|jgi:GT2 family glycosyltransferase|nr:glycosyltransferase [Flavobacteriaceae bacterium]